MKISLNGEWRFFIDSENTGISNALWGEDWILDQYSSLRKINLPNNWNIIPELEKYEGIVWFFHIINNLEDEKLENSDLFIQFKAVNYNTCLWINGINCGKHEGNFIPFKFKIEPNVFKKQNCIAVRVENLRKKNRIPTFSRDWFNWGGIYRDIDLFLCKKYRIDWVGVKTTILKGGQSKVEVMYEIQNPKPASEGYQKIISWKLFSLGTLSSQESRKKEPILVDSGAISTHLSKGTFSFFIKNAKLWSIQNPQLYQLQLFLQESQEPYIIRFGIREIKIVGENLFLNNKSVSLKGVSLHEELMPYGRAIPKEKRREDARNIKKLGFNALRTGHYPHDESIYEICDEEGLLVLEEIPVYWGIDFRDNQVLRKATQMTRDMIRRDFNHPSIIMWSVGNEIPILRKDCQQFMAVLIKYAKALDPSRIATCVLEFWASLVTPRKIIKAFDILCINQYIGWYYFNVYCLNLFLDSLHQRFKDRIIFVTEFGAGAKYGVHDSSSLPMKFSEERQASIIGHSIKIMNSKVYINGWFIWIYRDFRSHMHLNAFQEGFNRKGIISEKNEKKLITQCFPSLVGKKMEINQIRHHKKLTLLFYVVFYPIIRLFAVFITLVLTKFSDTGDQYYTTSR
jgi:beta-glucuronidase